MPHISNFENLAKFLPNRIAEILISAEAAAYENNLQAFVNLRQALELFTEEMRQERRYQHITNETFRTYYLDLSNELDLNLNKDGGHNNVGVFAASALYSEIADEPFCKKIVTLERMASSAVIHRDRERNFNSNVGSVSNINESFCKKLITIERMASSALIHRDNEDIHNLNDESALDIEGFTKKLPIIKEFALEFDADINIDEFEHFKVIYTLFKCIYAPNLREDFSITYIPVCGWRYEEKFRNNPQEYIEHNIIRRAIYSRAINANVNEYAIINIYKKPPIEDDNSGEVADPIKREYTAYNEIGRALFQERVTLDMSYYVSKYSRYYITVQRSPYPLKSLSYRTLSELSTDDKYSILKRLGNYICALNNAGIYIRTLTYNSVFLLDMENRGCHKYYPVISGLSGVKLSPSYGTVGPFLVLFFQNTILCPPEIKGNYNFNKVDWGKVDAYSYGLIVLHMFHNNVFGNIVKENEFRKALNNALSKEDNPIIKEGIKKLVCVEPAERGSIQEFLNTLK